jgi:hypothetical protein
VDAAEIGIESKMQVGGQVHDDAAAGLGHWRPPKELAWRIVPRQRLVRCRSGNKSEQSAA